MRGHLGATFRAMLLGALIGAVLVAAYFGLNHMSLGRGGAEAVERGFASGALVTEDIPLGNIRIGQHQFNDCLILGMAIDQRPGTEQLTVSPSLPFRNGTGDMCLQLYQITAQGAPKADAGFYHNYLHGHTMLVRYLLPVVEIGAIRKLFQMALVIVLLAGITSALVRLALGGAVVTGLFWTIVFFTFARWFGLEIFGQSLSHAPSDFILLGFALFLAVRSPNLSPLGAVLACAVFGALTTIFEFMTGGLPLGLALIAGGLPFALRPDSPRLPVLASSMAAFASAAAICMFAKLALVGLVFGRAPLAAVFTGLSGRMIGDAPDFAGQTLLGSLVQGTGYLVPGIGNLALPMLLIAAAAGAWGVSILLRTDERERALLLAASNLPIILWIAVFQQHSLVHGWFMARMFAWCIASGLALFALAVMARRGPGATGRGQLPSPDAGR